MRCALLAIVFAGCLLSSLYAGSGRELVIMKSDLVKEAQETEKYLRDLNYVVSNPDLEQYTRGIISKLMSSNAVALDSFAVIFIRASEANAFALIDNTVCIATGVLPIIENEDQYAFMLAHELFHIQKDHIIQRRYQWHEKSRSMLGGQIMGSIFLGMLAVIESNKSLVRAMCGFSREQESAADTGALAMIVKSGYDPVRAVKLFDRFKKRAAVDRKKTGTQDDGEGGEGGEGDTAGSKDHPSYRERSETCNAFIFSHHIASGKAGPLAGDAFAAKGGGFWVPTVEDLIDRAEFDAALFIAASHEDVFGVSPQSLALRGKTYADRQNVKDRDSAFTCFRRITGQNPFQAEAFKNMGYLFLKAQKTDSAFIYFDSYLQLNPSDNERGYVGYYRNKTHK